MIESMYTWMSTTILNTLLEYLVTVGYSSASESSGLLTTYIEVASGIGILQENVIVDVSTSEYSHSLFGATG